MGITTHWQRQRVIEMQMHWQKAKDLPMATNLRLPSWMETNLPMVTSMHLVIRRKGWANCSD